MQRYEKTREVQRKRVAFLCALSPRYSFLNRMPLVVWDCPLLFIPLYLNICMYATTNLRHFSRFLLCISLLFWSKEGEKDILRIMGLKDFLSKETRIGGEVAETP